MTSKDYYATLGVSKDATQDQIKQAYRKLAHQYHPDKTGGNEAKFKEVNEAYQVLGNQEKRQKYNQYGTDFEQMGGWGQYNWEDIMQGFRQGQGTRGESPFQGFSFDLGDIFSEFFGGGAFTGAGSRGERASRGRDLQTDVQITFDESISGTEKIIQLERFEKCRRCHGNKAEPGTALVECKRCNGRGELLQRQETFFGVMQSTAICPNCNGEGKLPKQNCSRCNGDGMERVSKEIKIKIPAGISDNEAIRFQGSGEISSDLTRYGDLYIRVHVAPHYKFKREGDDIYSTEPISFTQAVLGDKIRVDTIDGKIELKIPPGTHSGQVFKLKKKGAPQLRSYGKGDHYVTIKIAIPERVNTKVKRLLEELRKEGV